MGGTTLAVTGRTTRVGASPTGFRKAGRLATLMAWAGSGAAMATMTLRRPGRTGAAATVARATAARLMVTRLMVTRAMAARGMAHPATAARRGPLVTVARITITRVSALVMVAEPSRRTRRTGDFPLRRKLISTVRNSLPPTHRPRLSPARRARMAGFQYLPC